MFDIYYIEPQEVKLINRLDDSHSLFLIESPNGNGVYSIDIKEDVKSSYIDGSGELRKRFTKYSVILKYNYQSHFMKLERLLEADEIEIDFTFNLKDKITGKFVLKNEEVVKNFLANYPVDSYDYPSSEVSLEFESVKLYTEFELLNIDYYNNDIINIKPDAPTNFGVTVEYKSPVGWYKDGEIVDNLVVSDTGYAQRNTANMPYRESDNSIYFLIPLTGTSGYDNTVYRYNLLTGDWSNLNFNPDPFSSNGSTSGRYIGSDGYFYVPELYTEGETARVDMDAKTTSAILINYNYANGPATYDPVNNRLYLFNGQEGSSDTQLYIDLSDDTTTSIADAPTNLYGFNADYWDGKILLYRTNGNDTTIYQYDIASNSWSTFGNLPASGEITRLWSYGSDLYVLGWDMTVYKWDGSSWVDQNITSPLQVQIRAVTSIVGKTLWVFGGYPNDTFTGSEVLGITQALKFTS